MRKLIAMLMLAAAMTSAAHAADVTVGSVVKLNYEVPGCTFGGDAEYAWYLMPNGRAMEAFVNSVGFKIVKGDWRACTLLSTGLEWRIVQKLESNQNRRAWFCVESTLDFNVRSPGEPPHGPPAGCFWTRGPDTDRKALPMTQWIVQEQRQ
jgi:hypothetical protein